MLAAVGVTVPRDVAARALQMEGTEAPRVAICIAGLVRTMQHPNITEGFQQLAGGRDLFLVLGTSSDVSNHTFEPAKGSSGTEVPDAVALQVALTKLQPRRTLFMLRDEALCPAVDGMHENWPCTVQLSKWVQCERVASEYAKEKGLPPYDYLHISRPDLKWHQFPNFDALPLPEAEERPTVLTVDDNTHLVPSTAFDALATMRDEDGRNASCSYIKEECPKSEGYHGYTSCLMFALYRARGADVVESCKEDEYRQYRDELIMQRPPWLRDVSRFNESAQPRTDIARRLHSLSYAERFNFTGVHEITRWSKSDHPPAEDTVPYHTRVVCNATAATNVSCFRCLLGSNASDACPGEDLGYHELSLEGETAFADALLVRLRPCPGDDAFYSRGDRFCRGDLNLSLEVYVAGDLGKCICSDHGSIDTPSNSSFAGQQVRNMSGYSLGPTKLSYSERLSDL